MKKDVIILILLLSISIKHPVHTTNSQPKVDHHLPSSSSILQLSNSSFKVMQNESLTFYMQVFNPNNNSQPLDVSSLDLDITIWKIDPFHKSASTMRFDHVLFNDSTFQFYRRSFYGITSHNYSIQIEVDGLGDTTEYTYFILNLQLYEMPRPEINIMGLQDDRVYLPDDRFQFEINATLPIYNFDIYLGDTGLVKYGGPLSDHEYVYNNNTSIVSNNGSYIYKNITFDTYGPPDTSGILDLSISARTFYDGSYIFQENIEIEFDGEGPKTSIKSAPNKTFENTPQIDQYFLPAGGAIELELSSTDYSTMGWYTIEFDGNGPEYNITSSTVLIKDDGFMDGRKSSTLTITPYDIYGNRGEDIWVSIVKIGDYQKSDNLSTPISLILALIPIAIISYFRRRSSIKYKLKKFG